VPPTRRTLSAAAFSLKRLSQAKPDRQPKKDPWCGFHPGLNVPGLDPWYLSSDEPDASAIVHQFSESNVETDFESVDCEKAASAALVFMRRVALREEDGVVIPPGERPRPPPPTITPSEVEETSYIVLEGSTLFRPSFAAADDTDTGTQELLTPRFTNECRVGAAVEALLYGEWHDGRVLRLQGDAVEILWDSEYSMSFIPAEDIRVKIAGTPA